MGLELSPEDTAKYDQQRSEYTTLAGDMIRLADKAFHEAGDNGEASFTSMVSMMNLWRKTDVPDEEKWLKAVFLMAAMTNIVISLQHELIEVVTAIEAEAERG